MIQCVTLTVMSKEEQEKIYIQGLLVAIAGYKEYS
jgi:hypothetical protein